MAGGDAAGRVRAMSFNVRVDTAEDGRDAWTHRKELVASIVRLHEPTVLGCQEVLAGQLADLRDALPAYDWLGRGRKAASTAGEHVPIAYRSDSFELEDHGTFWLSERPAEPGSVGWDAALPRIVTHARLRDRAVDRELCVMNTHFDHRGTAARRHAATLLIERFDDLAADAPGVVMGDLNCVPDSPPHERLSERFDDARDRSAHSHHGPSYTFHGFDGTAGRRLDYVFVDGLDVRQHAVLADRWDDRYPSDHFPVVADLTVG